MAVAPNLVQPFSRSMLERLADARMRTDELFSLLKPDAIYDRPIPERHRIIFYVGHLEAFDWNLLRERTLHLEPFQPEYDRLFAFGIDPVGGGLPTDQPTDWPSIAEVRNYVRRVRDEIDRALDALFMGPGQEGEFPPELLLNVAVEHRLMHAETLAYMFHQLPFDRKVRSAEEKAIDTPRFDPKMIKIPAGKTEMGLRRDGGLFGWDNEFEAFTVDVPEFEVDEFKVTNGQFMEFIAAGGYERSEFWAEDDWKWRSEFAIKHPVFWRKRDNEWFYRGMFEEFPLPINSPVYVSQAESAGYAKFAGKSLPTESQWQRAAYGSEKLNVISGNFDFRHWDPVPVNAADEGTSGFGLRGMYGNGWEWTSTSFGPFPGFQKFPFYPGYSADFFDGKHYVMKGGSPRTAACMIRPSFRNWFQSHYQYVYAGFRCVRNA